MSRPKTELSHQTRQAIHKLRNQGLSIERIAGQINETTRQVKNVLRETPKPLSVREAKAVVESSSPLDWMHTQPEVPQPKISEPAILLSEEKVKQEPADPVQVARLKRQIQELEREKKAILDRFEKDAEIQSLLRFFQSSKPEPPQWTHAPSVGNGAHRSIVTAFLSDTHFDEVVKPEQVNYVNTYNREIAVKRLQKFASNTISLANEYLQGLKYEGLVLPLGGDLFSGNIHEELARTNEGTIFESLLYWVEQMLAAIRLLADAFGRVYIPVVAGNHGRNTKKPVAKNRNQDNFDWFFGHFLKLLLQADKRIVFNVSDSPDLIYPVFNTRYLLTHGDQFRGGSGIAGMLSPLMIGDHRKRKRASAIKLPYDFMVMGHWHTYFDGKGLIVNGSLKGYDEYAFQSNFDYEVPRQAFWITDEKHGKTITCPIRVEEQ